MKKSMVLNGIVIELSQVILAFIAAVKKTIRVQPHHANTMASLSTLTVGLDITDLHNDLESFSGTGDRRYHFPMQS
jgi:hypothetical protein